MREISYSVKQALNLRPRELISFVGAGGKTSLMFALAGELKIFPCRVITTTTTKIYPPSTQESPALILGEEMEALDSAITRYGQATWAKERTPADKLAGVSLAALSRFWFRNRVDYLLVEADGSARRPVKAPNSSEPVVPPETTMMVSVAGLTALGKPLNEEFCFRSEIAGRLMGMRKDQPMDPDGLVRLLVHPQGGLKGRKEGMRTAVFLNQVDDDRTLKFALRIAESVMERAQSQIERVIVGRLKPSPKFFSICEGSS